MGFFFWPRFRQKCWGAWDTTCEYRTKSWRHQSPGGERPKRGIIFGFYRPINHKGSPWNGIKEEVFWWSAWKGWERALVSQIVCQRKCLKVTLKKIQRDGVESIYGLSWAGRYNLELNSEKKAVIVGISRADSLHSFIGCFEYPPR